MLRTAVDGGSKLPSQIEQQGRTFITQHRRTIGPLGSTIHIGIIVPADHFTGAITALGRQSALISILFILATVPLIALASRAFSRPLHKLAAEADAIRAFELEQPVRVSSRVREIQALSTSMDRMKSGLRTFGIYVPRDLVRQLMSRASPPALGGERREITVLFSDIAGFTPIADGLEPEIVMQRMSTYFETATTALREHGGMIDKFMGDAVMAIWNALVADPDHALSACRGVLAMRAALAALSTRLVADGLAPMPTRFGLHTGEAVVGNVGSSERMNFTALGATVNLAARLEPLNKVFGTEILISEQVATRVREHFHIRSVAIVKPKGVGQPLRVHELLAERDSGGDFDWTTQWEAAFEAFIAGDFDTAAKLAEATPATLTADPVRSYLLARIARERGRHRDGAWNAVEAFR
jgi:adenylate cyclase